MLVATAGAVIASSFSAFHSSNPCRRTPLVRSDRCRAAGAGRWRMSQPAKAAWLHYFSFPSVKVCRSLTIA